MRAKKENKVYRIHTESEKQRYLKEGYDIYDDAGNLLEHSPLKKISYSAYAALQAELAALKSQAPAEDADVLEILTAYAEEHEIKLGNASTISGIIKKIKEQEGGA